MFDFDEQTYDIENQLMTTGIYMMEHVIDIEAPVIDEVMSTCSAATIDSLDPDFLTPVGQNIQRMVSEEIVWTPEIQDLLELSPIMSPPRLIRSIARNYEYLSDVVRRLEF